MVSPRGDGKDRRPVLSPMRSPHRLLIELAVDSRRWQRTLTVSGVAHSDEMMGAVRAAGYEPSLLVETATRSPSPSWAGGSSVVAPLLKGDDGGVVLPRGGDLSSAAAAPAAAAANATHVHDVSLSIDGMTCAACSANVERTLLALPGVESASVSLMSKSGRVSYDARRIDVPTLVAKVSAHGTHRPRLSHCIRCTGALSSLMATHGTHRPRPSHCCIPCTLFSLMALHCGCAPGERGGFPGERARRGQPRRGREPLVLARGRHLASHVRWLVVAHDPRLPWCVALGLQRASELPPLTAHAFASGLCTGRLSLYWPPLTAHAFAPSQHWPSLPPLTAHTFASRLPQSRWSSA
jgi:copper chaperone CopZ